MKKLIFGLIMMTAVLGKTEPAIAGAIEDPAMGPDIRISTFSLPRVLTGTNFFKNSAAQIEKMLKRNKPKPRKRWDPFKAARVIMTSA